ncbi:hypothetical protein WR25_19378 [Diploscapter pachys]|uniref:Inosine/uridine-preferring nucleoside hydrolase domain-containing protein n=1 Tax=Diploscapter pachys TaxID=2018661 RepID=A0A2A2KEL8_9BILA|nr:hypothetical protein WR25_19378 [Diploscapter pachys]
MKRVARANGRGDIPVYKGATDSLAGRPPIVIDEALFGVDGLGGVPDTEPKANQSDANGDHPEDAADVILRLTREIPNLTIICIGPLTNLAKARQKDPEFAHRPAKLIIMGGNYLGMGNSLPFLTAEWNFHCDPEAASIVLQQMQVPIRILPWEASFLRNQYPFINYTTHLLRNTSLASFLYNVTGTIRNYYASIGQQYPYCDEATIGIAFDEIVARNVPLRANVELNGNFTRGQLAIDYANTVWNDSLQSYVAYDPQESPKPHEFATLIDVKLLDDWMNLATGG